MTSHPVNVLFQYFSTADIAASTSPYIAASPETWIVGLSAAGGVDGTAASALSGSVVGVGCAVTVTVRGAGAGVTVRGAGAAVTVTRVGGADGALLTVALVELRGAADRLAGVGAVEVRAALVGTDCRVDGRAAAGGSPTTATAVPLTAARGWATANVPAPAATATATATNPATHNDGRLLMIARTRPGTG